MFCTREQYIRVAAIAHNYAHRGEEALYPRDALNGRRRRRRLGVIEVRQPVDLLGVEDGVPLREEDRVLTFFASRLVCFGARDLVGIDDEPPFSKRLIGLKSSDDGQYSLRAYLSLYVPL
jgi:hypothetical protein